MLVVGNGRMFTLDNECPYIENGAVAIDGKLIKKVGTTDALKKEFPDAEFIDAKGKVIMPALINSHNHIYSTMARGISVKGYNPDGFLDILDGMWWTLDRNLMLEQTELSAKVSYLEAIKNGVTTMFDHHASFGDIEGSLFKIGEQSKAFGVRSCLCYEVSDRDGADKAKAAIKENADWINYCQKDDTDMVKAMMGLHASFTVSNETLEECKKYVPEGVGYHVHVAEGIEDLHHCLKHYGKRLVNRFHDHGITGDKSLFVHCIYVNDQEMDLLRDTDTMVTHNPESNMGNACGCPPMMRIMEKGILTGLGTDGYTNDMYESLKVANVLHKHSLCDATVAWGETPQMLLENNRKIANRYFETPLGVLKEGASGDVIIVDYTPFTPMDETNLNGHIIFGFVGPLVTTTIASGKVLMKDRVVLGVDEEKIKADALQSAQKMWNNINK
ncbi:MAG: putative aminohydrolase SsnA [Eubacteriales bacterium]|nr:putative aminohydrolase SsnA [Eubacteriales bacterium]